MEWDCEDADLSLLLDGKVERICSFDDEKISLIQRSAPTNGRIQTALVLVEDAHLESSYEGRDVSGKIVFSRGDQTAIARMAVDKMGAAGILVDNMNEFSPVRDRMDIPNARQYTSFWPIRAKEFTAFGFVVSPRQGESLRKRFKDGAKEIPCSALVKSRFYDGSFEDVSAVIPGETAEEVVAIAHLCHPQPSANDNASGSGALLEAARALSDMVKDGRLPKPKRGIRFLWVPEMAGSYMYLAAHEKQLESYAAAINLDMVGENQDLCKGPFLVERPPKALAGFGGDLAESILREMATEVPNLGGTSSYALFKWGVTPFSGGSDHYVWADPTVGVTCPMLIQWPDRYYHTSEDTIDKVDPKMLNLAGTLTACYLYFAASAAPAEAASLAREMASHFEMEIGDAVAGAIRSAAEDVGKATPHELSSVLAKHRRVIEARCAFLASRKIADLSSLSRLCGDSLVLDEAKKSASESVERIAAFHAAKSLAELACLAGLERAADLPPALVPEGDSEDKAESIVPQRVYKGPFAGRGHIRTSEDEADLEAFSKKHKGAIRYSIYVQYWTDGVRNLREIADLVEGETGGRNMEFMLDYVELGKKQGAFK